MQNVRAWPLSTAASNFLLDELIFRQATEKTFPTGRRGHPPHQDSGLTESRLAFGIAELYHGAQSAERLQFLGSFCDPKPGVQEAYKESQSSDFGCKAGLVSAGQ